jgi:hypothetical protein
MTKLEEAKWQVRRLKGLLKSGMLKQNEVEAKKHLLRQWELELRRLGG